MPETIIIDSSNDIIQIQIVASDVKADAKLEHRTYTKQFVMCYFQTYLIN
jgi:hypothetical protein